MDNYVLSGANVHFNCIGYGDPWPKVIWKKNSEIVKKTDRVIPTDGLLHILSVKVEDAGTYECILSNSYGEDKRSAVLNVDGQLGGKWFAISFPGSSLREEQRGPWE